MLLVVIIAHIGVWYDLSFARLPGVEGKPQSRLLEKKSLLKGSRLVRRTRKNGSPTKLEHGAFLAVHPQRAL